LTTFPPKEFGKHCRKIFGKTTNSPNENTQQSTGTKTPKETQEEGDERNVDASLRTPKVIVNVFRMFNWFMEERWLCIPRKRLEEDVTEEANINNTTNKVSGRKLFKLFFQSLERIKIDIFLKLPLTTID
jgi:hypothetical protein